jgi:hypothetical protein
MSGKEHIQAPQEDDDQINRALRENLPENINEVDLGAKEQKGKLSPSILTLSFSPTSSILSSSPSPFPSIPLPPASPPPTELLALLTLRPGLLSFIGDPIGKGLQKGLSPVGNLVGGTGDRMAGFTKQDQPNRAGGEGDYEKFGGKEQNGGNPLGL